MSSTRTKGFAIVGLVVLGLVVGAGSIAEPPGTSSPSVATFGPGFAERSVVADRGDQGRHDHRGVTIIGTGSGTGISAIGTAKDPIENLTIRDCTIRGFETGIDVRHVKNLTIENCTIDDSTYAGILVHLRDRRTHLRQPDPKGRLLHAAGHRTTRTTPTGSP